MSPQQDDKALVARIAAGDKEAAELFDLRFRARLLRFAQSRRVPDQDQDDIVQEVFLAAFKNFSENGFHEESALGTWLVGILNHKIADYWERRRRENAPSEPRGQAIEGTIQSELDQIPDPAPHLDIAVELRQRLSWLPKEHRVILILNITEGQTTDEIAVFLKMPPGTVGRLLWEAKRMLREKKEVVKKLDQIGD